MNDNEIFEEEAMDSNRKRMKALDKLFSLAFYVCAAYFAINLIIDVVGVGVALMTWGRVAENPMTMVLKLIEHIVMLGMFFWSYLKDRIGTIASIAAVVIWLMFGLAIGGADMAALVIAIVWIGMQILCLTKYKELEYLKAQPGYPDFNGIFLHNNSNRIATNKQIREQLRENKGAVMEGLDSDGSLLGNNNAAGHENQYMEGISADDINGAGELPDDGEQQ